MRADTTLTASGPVRFTRADLGIGGEAAVPSSITETALTVIWSEVLGIDGIGVEDDFFELGGDSLQGAELMTSIEQKLNVVLPVSALIEARTPRALATLVRATQARLPPKCLIPVRKEGAGPILFCVHGMTGDAIFAHTLALAMGPGRPVYAFRAYGLAAGEDVEPSLEKWIPRYVDEIVATQPEGPYLLMGYCGGSWIAFEAAQALRRAGKEVAGLVLIDPGDALRLAPWLQLSGLPLKLVQGAVRIRGEYFRQRMRQQPSGKKRRTLVLKTLKTALGQFVPEPYGGRALLLLAGERQKVQTHPRRGLPRLFPAGAEIHVVTHVHKHIFVQEVRTVAAATARFLDEVAPVAGKPVTT